MRETLGEVAREPASGDRARRVQEDRAPPPAVRAGEDVADRRRVLLRGAAAQVFARATGDAEVERVDRSLPDAAAYDLAHEVRADGRELVDPARAVDDEGPARAEAREHLGDRAHEAGLVDADDLGAGAGRVRQRPEDVEDGASGELPPDRGRMAHGRMMGGREEEPEAELVDREGDSLGRELELEA